MQQRCGTRPGTRAERGNRSRAAAGFSVTELLTVLAIIAVGSAMATMIVPGVVRFGRMDSGSQQVAGIIRQAREEAIAKRRNIEVAFDTAKNEMRIVRVDYDWTTTPATPVEQLERTVPLEGGVKFLRFSSIAAVPVPAVAPNGNVVTFPELKSLPTVTLTPEGAAVDPVSGDPIDGTIFLGRTNEKETARALTVAGVTANIERWYWNSTAWVAGK
jgi:prepilin-type N-terminal cleavage/methylation domain-containing protein